MSETQQVGRLAFRQEGNQWVAYFADSDTMENAIWIASIHMGAVRNPERRQQFIDLARGSVGDFMEDRLGARPGWEGERPAPEYERAGHS